MSSVCSFFRSFLYCIRLTLQYNYSISSLQCNTFIVLY
nr:MAG TPA: hypothetical protein [Caudoviricetes sp.]